MVVGNRWGKSSLGYVYSGGESCIVFAREMLHPVDGPTRTDHELRMPLPRVRVCTWSPSQVSPNGGVDTLKAKPCTNVFRQGVFRVPQPPALPALSADIHQPLNSLSLLIALFATIALSTPCSHPHLRPELPALHIIGLYIISRSLTSFVSRFEGAEPFSLFTSSHVQ